MLRPLAELFVRLGLQTESFDKGLADAKKQSQGFADQIRGLAGEMGMAISAGGLLKGAVAAAAGAEDFISRMEIVIGNLNEAVRLEGVMSDFDMAKGLKESVEPAVMALIRAGTTIDEMPVKLELLSDVAAGTGGSVNALANAMIRMQQTPMQSRMLEMMFRRTGVQLGSVAKQIGITEQAWKQMVATNKVDANFVMRMFEKLTAEGGKWADASEKQASTWNAMWRRMKSTLGEVSESIGGGLLPVIKGIVNPMIAGVNAILKFDAATGGLLGKVAAGALMFIQVKSSLAIFNRVMGTTYGTGMAVAKMFGLLMKAGVWGAVIAGVGLAIWGVVEAFKSFADWLSKTAVWQKTWKTASQNFTAAWQHVKAGAQSAWDMLKSFASWLVMNNPITWLAKWSGVKGDDIATFASNFVLRISEAVKLTAKTFRFLAENWGVMLSMMGAKYDAFMERIAAGAAAAIGAEGLRKAHEETMKAFLATADNYQKILVKRWAELDKGIKFDEAAKAAKKPAVALSKEISKLKVNMLSLDDYWLKMMTDMEESSERTGRKTVSSWTAARRADTLERRAAGRERGKKWGSMSEEERAASTYSFMYRRRLEDIPYGKRGEIGHMALRTPRQLEAAQQRQADQAAEAKLAELIRAAMINSLDASISFKEAAADIKEAAAKGVSVATK